MNLRAKLFLGRLSPILIAIFLAVPTLSIAKGKAQSAAARVELVVQGPETFGGGKPFIATIINRSKVPVTFVPPKSDWYDEFTLIWTVFEPGGKELSHAPKQFAWCDGLAFHSQFLPEPGIFIPLKKKVIQEKDIVTLGPGEKLQLCELGDPIQFFPITNQGKYKIALVYKFDPSHYVLSSGSASSPKSEALKAAVPLDLVSKELTVRREQRLDQTLSL